jgi:hypothetical protein
VKVELMVPATAVTACGSAEPASGSVQVPTSGFESRLPIGP